jgi:hypothetical protein
MLAKEVNFYYHPHPLYPPLPEGEGEEIERGAKPLLKNRFPLPLIREGGQGDGVNS